MGVPSGRVFIGRRLVWLAWYPLRRHHCLWAFDRSTIALNGQQAGWHFAVAVGPLYLGLGPGRAPV